MILGIYITGLKLLLFFYMSLVRVSSTRVFFNNIFMTLQDAIINDSRDNFEERGVKAADIERVVSGYPESFLDDYRKKKSYISSILAKNEVDSPHPRRV
jgi:hypothetical protein